MIIVKKFGGTSVGDTKKITAVAAKVAEAYHKGEDIIVVVSAMSGETNRLLSLARDFNESKGAAVDVLLATGEQVTVALLCMALKNLNVPSVPCLGWQIPVETDSSFGKARINRIPTNGLKKILTDKKVVVAAGFQGVNEQGAITTLGRGGSDTSAVALAAAIEADECQIFTDVDGVYTTDPRLVPEARKLNNITYEEMLEMASLGAKVLQIRAVEFASKYNVKLRVLSSFQKGEGTSISKEVSEMEKAIISGVALNKNEAQIKVIGVTDRPGIASDILGPVADQNIEVDMIVQNLGEEGITDFTFTVSRDDFQQTKKILEPLLTELGATRIDGDTKIVKLSIVGVGMRSHSGIASKMFRTLAEENINIKMISTSEIKISVVIDEKYSELGVRCLHSAFELETGQ